MVKVSILRNRNPYTWTLQKEFATLSRHPTMIPSKTSCSHLLQPWPQSRQTIFWTLSISFLITPPPEKKNQFPPLSNNRAKSVISGLINLTALKSACVVLGENGEEE